MDDYNKSYKFPVDLQKGDPLCISGLLKQSPLSKDIIDKAATSGMISLLVEPSARLYSFKESPQDFMVDECMDWAEPSGYGKFLYIKYKKTGENSLDIVHTITKLLGVSHDALGTAGVKDKHAETYQRLSIDMTHTGNNQEEIIDKMKYMDTIEIISHGLHHKPLRIGSNKGNVFTIALNAKRFIDPETKGNIQEKIKKIKHDGFPNYYGSQRFGNGRMTVYDKIRQGEITHNNLKNRNPIWIQGVTQSIFFNTLLAQKVKENKTILDGTLLKNGDEMGILLDNKVYSIDKKNVSEHIKGKTYVFVTKEMLMAQPTNMNEKWLPTSLVPGYGMLLGLEGSPAAQYEEHFLQEQQLDNSKLQKFYRYKGLKSRRRPAIVKPEMTMIDPEDYTVRSYDLRSEFDNENNIVLDFFLPSGSYATVLLYHIFKDIDRQTCRENKRTIYSLDNVSQ